MQRNDRVSLGPIIRADSRATVVGDSGGPFFRGSAENDRVGRLRPDPRGAAERIEAVTGRVEVRL